MKLTAWPKQGVKELETLYTHVNQKYCLVQIPLPLPTEQTQSYVNAIDNGVVEGKAFWCRAIQEDDDIIGKIELTKHDDGKAELDLVLRKEYENKGLGTKAIQEAIAFVEQENWCISIEAYVNQENIAMMKALEHNGFVRRQKFKADIVVPRDQLYELKEVTGYAYTYDFLSRL